jgi:hypothetical protein
VAFSAILLFSLNHSYCHVKLPYFKMFWSFVSPRLRGKEAEDGQHLLEVEGTHVPRSPSVELRTMRYITLSSALFSIYLLVIGIKNPSSSYENGFMTDLSESTGVCCTDLVVLILLDPAKRSISIEERTFTGGLRYDDTGVLVANKSSYVGIPSVEVDEAWEKLLEGNTLLIQINFSQTNISRTLD